MLEIIEGRCYRYNLYRESSRTKLRISLSHERQNPPYLEYCLPSQPPPPPNLFRNGESWEIFTGMSGNCIGRIGLKWVFGAQTSNMPFEYVHKEHVVISKVQFFWTNEVGQFFVCVG